MKKNLEKFRDTEHCPVRNVLARVGDKWSLLVLGILREVDHIRFNELHRSIGDISQKMLTVTLRSLEKDGLISRAIYAEVPPRVEYTLTNLGQSLVPHIQTLADWAFEHMSEIKRAREA